MTNQFKQGRICFVGDSKELFVQRFVKVFDQKRNQRTGTPVVFTLPL